jgi:hypothetical protein
MQFNKNVVSWASKPRAEFWVQLHQVTRFSCHCHAARGSRADGWCGVPACRLHQARLGAGIRVRREVDLTPILSPVVARAQKNVAILITTTSPTQNIVFGVSKQRPLL